MLKRVILSVFILTFIFFTFYFFSLAKEVETEPEKINYYLPYPGILPDHPLYSLKVGRDRIMDFFTRDNLKKAKLYLIISDKRINMATELTKKGKWQMASSTASKGEKYFLKIPDLIRSLEKQGGSSPKDFIIQAKLANAKHIEVIEALLKDAPQAERTSLQETLKLSKQIEQNLSALK